MIDLLRKLGTGKTQKNSGKPHDINGSTGNLKINYIYPNDTVEYENWKEDVSVSDYKAHTKRTIRKPVMKVPTDYISQQKVNYTPENPVMKYRKLKLGKPNKTFYPVKPTNAVATTKLSDVRKPEKRKPKKIKVR